MHKSLTMPTSLQNLISNSMTANMLGTWVCMLKKTSNHVSMAFLHELSCLNSINFGVYIYVNKCLQLLFNGLKKLSEPI